MSTKRYPQEVKDRAIRLVREARQIDPSDRDAIRRISRQLGVSSESLRAWVNKAGIDTGKVPGVTTAESAHIKDLEREVRELRRTNEILKLASAFFARELDPQSKW